MRWILTFGLLLTPTIAIAQSATVIDASTKIRPTDGPGPNSTAEIRAAQNEFEAFQLIIRGPVNGVSVSLPSLLGPGGASIPGSKIRLYREAYLNISTASNTEGGTGLWPDALIPHVDEVAGETRNAFPFNVPSGENRVVWVEVHVPKGQTPGNYQGTLAVTGTGFSASVPVTLVVWDFELPSTSSLPSTFGMGWDAACVAHYGSYPACGGDAGVEATHLLYARYMLDHRVTVDVVYTGPTSCTGASCNWDHFDATYGPLFDGTDPNLRLQGAKQTTIRYIWTDAADHYAAWADHFRDKGWFDRTYDYTCDEPPEGCSWSDLEMRADRVHGADPDFRTLVTTDIGSANTNNVTSRINILSPIVNYMHDKPGELRAGNQRSTYDSFLQSNPRNLLWWYQSCMSHGCYIVGDSYHSVWPSFMVDNSAVQNRAQGMLSWLYDVGGVLYFTVTHALTNAWSSVYAFGGNGDGTLLYPGKPAVIGGTTHIPVASIRLKMIREGFEDYEYMKLVSDLGDPAFADQAGWALFPNAHSANQPASAVYATREALAQRILQLKGASNPGQLTLVAPLQLSPGAPLVGQSVTASFTVRNTGGQPISVSYFLAGARNPSNGNVDFPASTQVTLQPSQQYVYQASRTFSTAGSHLVWPSYYNGTTWIDLAPSRTPFTVGTSMTRYEENHANVTLTSTWGAANNSNASGGRHISSTTAGATLSFAFNGTGITWIGVADSCSGRAEVRIDGGSPTVVDTYRASGLWQQVLYSVSGLSAGAHTFSVNVLGTKQAASCAAWVYADAFEVQN